MALFGIPPKEPLHFSNLGMKTSDSDDNTGTYWSQMLNEMKNTTIIITVLVRDSEKLEKLVYEVFGNGRICLLL